MTPRRPLLALARPFASALLALSAAACGSDSDSEAARGGAGGLGGSTACAVAPPATYDAPSFDENAAGALALRARLQALTESRMRGMETGDVTPEGAAALLADFEAGDPSLASLAPAPVRAVVEAAFDEFAASVAAGAQDLVDDQGAWTPGVEGGIWSSETRAINEGGLESRQIVDKALFSGGTLYAYALGLTEGALDEAVIDDVAAAFGANAALNPGRNDDVTVANQNTHAANYVYQMGRYAEARETLIAARAYAADPECTAERDAAIITFFRDWELGMMARFVYYANEGVLGVSAATDDDARADALHELSEGLGLAIGFLGIADPTSGPLAGAGRVVTDAELQAIVEPLGLDLSGDLGEATVGAWFQDPLGFSSAVRTVEGLVGDVYGLGAADVEAFREPADG